MMATGTCRRACSTGSFRSLSLEMTMGPVHLLAEHVE